MIEFCDNCGSILLPSKKKGDRVLKCTLCNKIKPIDDDIIDSYTITKVIEHPKRE